MESQLKLNFGTLRDKKNTEQSQLPIIEKRWELSSYMMLLKDKPLTM